MWQTLSKKMYLCGNIVTLFPYMDIVLYVIVAFVLIIAAFLAGRQMGQSRMQGEITRLTAERETHRVCAETAT